MYVIAGEDMQERALEDIVEILSEKPVDKGEYITHVSNLIADHTIAYIQKKFSISNKGLKKYLNKKGISLQWK